jgi:hypothetical protein
MPKMGAAARQQGEEQTIGKKPQLKAVSSEFLLHIFVFASFRPIVSS